MTEGEQAKRTVWLLHHCAPQDDWPETDDKLIGVFDSEEAALAAKAAASTLPGFRKWPDAFDLSPHQLNRVGWTEGFGRERPDGTWDDL